MKVRLVALRTFIDRVGEWINQSDSEDVCAKADVPTHRKSTLMMLSVLVNDEQ